MTAVVRRTFQRSIAGILIDILKDTLCSGVAEAMQGPRRTGTKLRFIQSSVWTNSFLLL